MGRRSGRSKAAAVAAAFDGGRTSLSTDPVDLLLGPASARRPCRPLARRGAVTAVGLAAVIAVLALLGPLVLGWSLTWSEEQGVRMAPGTALGVLFVGAGIAFFGPASGRRRAVLSAGVLLPLVASLSAPLLPPALHGTGTGTAFLLCALAFFSWETRADAGRPISVAGPLAVLWVCGTILLIRSFDLHHDADLGGFMLTSKPTAASVGLLALASVALRLGAAEFPRPRALAAVGGVVLGLGWFAVLAVAWGWLGVGSLAVTVLLIALAGAGVAAHLTKSALAERQAEEANRQALHRSLLTGLSRSVPLALTDPDGVITHANPALEGLSGYAVEELVGAAPSVLGAPGNHEPDFWRSFWDTISRGEVWVGRVRNRHASGRAYWVHQMAVPLTDAKGEITGYAMFPVDATAEVEREAALTAANASLAEAAQLKAKFLATMSHEVRTPMNGVMGMVEMLEDTELDAAQAELVSVLRESSGALLDILNGILDISRLEAGKLQLEVRPADLHATVRAVVSLFRKPCVDKAVNLELDLDPAADGQWWLDGTRVRQVLSNLVGNAVKFTEQGRITVRTRGTPTGVRIEVEDTGIGMDAGARDKVFEPFMQAEADTNRRFGGTGLGLAIVKSLVDLMGGVVGVDSEAGEGSRFWVELPSEEAAGTAPRSSSSVGGAAGPRFDLHVLVVEDDEVNARVAMGHLTRLGCCVSRARDGLEGAQMVEAAERPFDLILMDRMMPVMDGFEATRRIRRLEAEGTPAARQVIVCASAAVAPEDRDEATEAGVDDFLGKPFRRRDIVALLERWSEARQVADGAAGTSAGARI